MQHPDSARFLFSLAKRARKYYLGLTTITQDVEDFVATDMGKAIITNSSLQFLMKQSPSSVDKLQEVFYLSAGEKSLLLSSNVGEGLFFAGSAHVALQVIASPQEHRLITTDPRELDELADLSSEEEEKINYLLAGENEPQESPQGPQQVDNSSQANDGQIDTANSPGLPPMAEPSMPAEEPSSGQEDELYVSAKRDSRIGSPELPLPQPAATPSEVGPTPLVDTKVAHELPRAPIMDTDNYKQPTAERSSMSSTADSPSPSANSASPANGYIDVFGGTEPAAPSGSAAGSGSSSRQSLNLVSGD